MPNRIGTSLIDSRPTFSDRAPRAFQTLLSSKRLLVLDNDRPVEHLRDRVGVLMVAALVVVDDAAAIGPDADAEAVGPDLAQAVVSRPEGFATRCCGAAATGSGRARVQINQ